ncbi:hypothetical protein MKX03_008202, partial [Papaver bracteatum]
GNPYFIVIDFLNQVSDLKFIYVNHVLHQEKDEEGLRFAALVGGDLVDGGGCLTVKLVVLQLLALWVVVGENADIEFWKGLCKVNNLLKAFVLDQILEADLVNEFQKYVENFMNV